jgi:hypothetical protein
LGKRQNDIGKRKEEEVKPMDYFVLNFQDDSVMVIRSFDDMETIEDAIKTKADWVYLYDERCYINLNKINSIMREGNDGI